MKHKANVNSNIKNYYYFIKAVNHYILSQNKENINSKIPLQNKGIFFTKLNLEERPLKRGTQPPSLSILFYKQITDASESPSLSRIMRTP